MAGAALVVSACASPRAGGFDAPDPAARLAAIDQAAREGDVGAVGRIIEQLDSDDPAVRLLAIGALERLTGRTMGYRHYDPPRQRRAAIGRWVAAWESGNLQTVER